MANGRPAVAYVRKSTGSQGCSIENQLAAINVYAERYGFYLLRNYADVRSGVTLRGRSGLQALLSIVQSGNADFQAVLVYDVSRWGRFQDVDEGAFYEYLCLRAGIPVHYCAEPFDNNRSVATGIIKSVKRVMAGEFSRQLSGLVFAAQARASELGYRQGGYAGYGLRRVAVDDAGNIVSRFEFGESKGNAYRTTLVPGPAGELRTIERIYRMYLDDDLGMVKIAEVLNKEGVQRDRLGTKWTDSAVRQILTNEKYIGTHRFNCTSTNIGRQGKRVNNADSKIIRHPNAFPAIVKRALFERAQAKLRARTTPIAAEKALEHLRRILERDGLLSAAAIEADPDAPALAVYRNRFGSLSEAYRIIGYRQTPGPSKERQAALLRALYDDLIWIGQN